MNISIAIMSKFLVYQITLFHNKSVHMYLSYVIIYLALINIKFYLLLLSLMKMTCAFSINKLSHISH